MRPRLVVALLALAAAPLAAQSDSVPAHVIFLDVGQADAVLIRSPEGKTALIDAGRGSIIRRLEAHDVDTIDIAIASHAHADHIGGMAEVIRRFTVRYYMDNGLPHTTRTYGDLMWTLERSDVTYLQATERTIQLGSVTLRVLPPPHLAAAGDPHLDGRGRPTGQNDQSVGILMEYCEFRALLTGDSEVDELHTFLERGVPTVTVLKAAHHGARNGVTPAWLAATRPRVVVISVGRNSYGHPDPWAIRYYEAQGRQVYRTDLHGDVTIAGRSDGSYEVITTRGGYP